MLAFEISKKKIKFMHHIYTKKKKNQLMSLLNDKYIFSDYSSDTLYLNKVMFHDIIYIYIYISFVYSDDITSELRIM